MSTPVNFFDLSFSELEDVVSNLGQPSFRAKQIWKGIYQSYWASPSNFSNIPLDFRYKLEEYFSFYNLVPQTNLSSNDHKTYKYLFRLPDSQAIETVRMDYDKRHTLCISTQVGCAMNCSFCATGQMGFNRNLTSGEMVEQMLFFSRDLAKSGAKVTNIVLMGMGEPFLNYENVIKAIDTLNDPQGLNFGERRFTLSTVGIIPIIRRFTDEHRQINLAISLHAPYDELRSSMLPINKKYPVAELLEACHNYVSATHRRITFEYALVDGVNDADSTARDLALLLKGLICHVNLIPLNPTSSFNGNGSSIDTADRFSKILNQSGITATVRLRRGIDIHAGCGQLASSLK